ncbi:hypothetical protein [Mycobacteroides abscessus]|uniref:hypothetical protein n=2 Tax=Mycobacteroides abscessus TaxID=36809 RepID=UPI000C265C2B|nr:hypothetical protein [Mycobacteroides abscessus]AWG62953.1 hypothetical protein DDT46_03460 [Mycobacteroides abscessus]PVA29554.1 hypothetical protein DDJ88_13900 [Mycobacteroides abscessus]PVA43460.1 hypothetical protein DDJ35_22730 [Mycobacteroides abscessus]PVA73588.1 hypothetical protein DDJ37_14285 [Mycobacteroides abscessus]PVB12073.1 hypothetical protein DDJ40_17105 [Mycobacteroides abscessus]
MWFTPGTASVVSYVMCGAGIGGDELQRQDGGFNGVKHGHTLHAVGGQRSDTRGAHQLPGLRCERTQRSESPEPTKRTRQTLARIFGEPDSISMP